MSFPRGVESVTFESLTLEPAAGRHPCQAKTTESMEQEAERSRPLTTGERSGPCQLIIQKDSANTSIDMS